jgi:hypothetical protein
MQEKTKFTLTFSCPDSVEVMLELGNLLIAADRDFGSTDAKLLFEPPGMPVQTLYPSKDRVPPH